MGNQVDEEEAQLSDDSLSIEQDFVTQSILIYNKKFNVDFVKKFLFIFKVDELNLNN